MKTAANLATDPTHHYMLLEQKHMIDTLQEHLQLALHRQFGPRNETVEIDQLVLFAANAEADTHTAFVLAVNAAEAVDTAHTAPGASAVPAERKKAIRILKDPPRDVRIIDIPDADRVCPCCGSKLHHFSDECSEKLGYVSATVKIIETHRKKYACQTCHGEIMRANRQEHGIGLPAGLLLVCKFADHLPLYPIAVQLQRLG